MSSHALHRDFDFDTKPKRVCLDSVNDYPGWGVFVATVYLQVKMLSMLDTKLPYCPVNAQAKVASEKVHWEGLALKNVFDRFKSLDVVRPKIVLPFDPNEFVIIDANVTKEEAAKNNAMRKKFHDYKFKCYEQDVIAYEDRLRRAVAAEVVVLMDSAKDIV